MIAIDKKTNAFAKYLKKDVLGKELSCVLESYNGTTDIYVFSGVIRDFILNKKNTKVRDVDFVVKDIPDNAQLLELWRKYYGKKNSFGGGKFQFDGLSVDVWELDKTWGIVKKNEVPSVDSLIDSSFFNCTAIVYSVRNNRFIYHSEFLDFINNQILDIVYDKNPNEPLCIVNAFLYKEKYSVSFSERLKEWIKDKSSYLVDYEEAQRRHFQEVLIDNQHIKNLIRLL